MNLKETLPKLQDVLGQYGVVTPPNSRRNTELRNSWSTDKQKLLKARGNDLLNFSNLNQGSIGTSDYPSTPPLIFETQKWASQGPWNRFVLDLKADEKNSAGRFWLSHNNEQPNVWWFDHRDTRSEYRGAEIGNSVSEAVDVMMQNLANNKSEEQVITCEVEQVDVLLWFLKNGYVACNNESQGLIDQVLGNNGHENFEISSHPNGGMEFCIFRKGKVDWEGVKNIHELKEKGQVVTIKLEKKFSPESMPFSSRIRQKLRRLFPWIS